MACAGVRHLFVGQLFERRPSYRVLGMLLFAQITASATVQALQSLAASRRALTHQLGVADAAGDRKAALRTAVVLQVRVASCQLACKCV